MAYASYDFFVLLGYFLVILYYGVKVNEIDYEFKELLVKLAKDCNEIKTFCDNGRVWMKKSNNKSTKTRKCGGDIELFEKTKDGKWKNNNGEIYENLDEFININDKVEHQVGDLLTSIESAVDRLDYKIENYQVKFFGTTIDNDFILNIILLVVSLVVGII